MIWELKRTSLNFGYAAVKVWLVFANHNSFDLVTWKIIYLKFKNKNRQKLVFENSHLFLYFSFKMIFFLCYSPLCIHNNMIL